MDQPRNCLLVIATRLAHERNAHKSDNGFDFKEQVNDWHDEKTKCSQCKIQVNFSATFKILLLFCLEKAFVVNGIHHR